MAITRFNRNYTDQSTDTGFQFEFFCDRCGSGYQTEFSPAGFNVMSDVLDAAGNLFGGVMGAVASLGGQARSAKWEAEHDAAFKKAVSDVQGYFHQCKQCSIWVDQACWSPKKQCCKGCLEDLSGSEPETRSTDAECSACSASVSKTAKFCPECGQSLQRTQECPGCGADASGKFCSDCGHQL